METNTSFEFTKNIILEDERTVLRPLEITDFDYLINFSLAEPDLWRYSLVQASGAQGLKNYLKDAVEAREAKREYPFIVFDKRKNCYAGSTRFYDIQLFNRCSQIGYTWYGGQFQGTGLNKHCKFLLLDYAFGKMGMERVEFRADSENERSIAAMISIGCKVEGILRSTATRPDGNRRDSIVLSILKNEWENSVKENLRKKILKYIDYK